MNSSKGNKQTPHKVSVSTPIKKSFSERYTVFRSTSSPPNGRETKVKIMNVINDEGHKVGFGVNGFFGGKDYFTNTMNCASMLLYTDRLNAQVSTDKISNLADVSYAAMNPTTPTVFVSAFPVVENMNVKEDINDTYQAFLTAFQDQGDPVNNCPVKFTIMEDFILDNEVKINNFFYLTTLIQLPIRLRSTTVNQENA